MGIYARRPARLAAQLTADLVMVVWVVFWWATGRLVDDTIRAVAGPARQSSAATRELAGQIRETADQAGRLPAVGEDLRRPLDAAVESVSGLTAAADNQVASIERLAGVVGWLVFLVPVVILLAVWLPARLRFYLRARAAQRFIDSSADLDLFALRAMVTQPMHVIARIDEDPVGAWRRGDRRVIDALAARELRQTGLRMPEISPRPASGGGQPNR